MTQRNNTDSAEILKGADAFVATANEQSTFAGAAAPATSPAHRTRRAARIAVAIPVAVRDQFGGREEMRTRFVMVQGAVLGTNSNVRVGHKLTIQNVKSGRSAECHVIGVEPALTGTYQVEVEFIRNEPDFWPVQFPTEDSKPERARVSPPVLGAEGVSSSARINENSEIPPRKHGQLVSLADAITQDYTPAPPVPTAEKFTPKAAPLDSVAQFRAANRAAHRREQRKKALFSVIAIAVLAGMVAAARSWIEHRPEGFQASMPSVVESSTSAVAKETAAVAVKTSPPSRASAPPATAAASAQSQSASPGAPISSPTAPTITLEIPASAAANPGEGQVAVRHGASTPPLRRASDESESGEAPLALPLRVGEEPTSEQQPAVLNDVVAQASVNTAVLQAQAPARAVAAKLIYSIPAQYPGIARQMRVEGEVILSVAVDVQGNVSSAKAVSGPPVLRAAAVDSVRRWRYQPATLGEKPIASTETVRVLFHLK
jgi:TonB family protein